MQKIICFLTLLLLFCMCNGGNKKRGLSEDDIRKAPEIDITGYDSLPFNSGVKFTGCRSVDKSDPPKIINYNNTITEADFDISKYYEKVKYVYLKHPGTEEGSNRFFTPVNKRLMFSGFGGYSVDLFAQVLFTDKYILAGDIFYGLHCYDLDGNFLYTLTTSVTPPLYKEKGDIDIRLDNTENTLASFKVVDNICLFVTLTNKKATIHFHDLDSRTTYYQRQMDVHKALPLNSKEFANFRYNLTADKKETFINTFSTSRDTLSQFINYNILPKFSGGSYQSPGPSNIYYYNDELTVRQVGNDTVYRFVSAEKLKPVYILDFGKEKPDMQDLVSGKRENKKVLWDFLETDKFIYARYNHVGVNSETTRKRHAIYDKYSGSISFIPNRENHNKVLINNQLKEGLPFHSDQMKSNGKQLYCVYAKAHFEYMMDLKEFGELPDVQQELVKKVYGQIDKETMLVVILE